MKKISPARELVIRRLFLIRSRTLAVLRNENTPIIDRLLLIPRTIPAIIEPSTCALLLSSARVTSRSGIVCVETSNYSTEVASFSVMIKIRIDGTGINLITMFVTIETWKNCDIFDPGSLACSSFSRLREEVPLFFSGTGFLSLKKF